MTQHGSTSTRTRPQKTFRKPRKPRDTPHAWLKRLICPFDFGLKVTTMDPETTKESSHPIHCNRNRDILAAFLDKRRWMHVGRLTNRMLDEHWNGEETFYFTAAGSSRCRLALFNLDIDCHASGSERGAFEAAEYLKANFFPGLYHEPSTNGRGRHGYFILDKSELGAEYVKVILKGLERHLNLHLLSEGFDIELFEIKGLPPVLTWGDDGQVTSYTAGILAKIPRQVERFEEWKRTCTLTDSDIGRMFSRLRATAAEVPVTPERHMVRSETVEAPATGSTPGKVIGDEEFEQVAEGGHYRRIASILLGTHTLRTTARTIVTADDVAIFLLCLKFFTNRMNADGTLPVKRFEGLWTAMYKVGDVRRAFDCHRFKVIRDYLSGLGLLDWEDNTFVAPREGRDGTKLKGRACKWKAGEVLMGMLDWGKVEVGADDVQIEDVQRERGGEGEAPLVGAGPSSRPPSADQTLVETIRSLFRVPDGEEIRPMEVVTAGQMYPGRFTPEEVTRLVLSFEEAMERLAA